MAEWGVGCTLSLAWRAGASLAGVKLCLAWGPRVQGESPTPGMGVGRAGAKASGFELGLGAGAKNRGNPFQGGSLAKGIPISMAEKMIPHHPFLS